MVTFIQKGISSQMTPSGLGARAGSLLYARWSEFRSLRIKVLKSEDVDDIHDLRVASRRIRAVLGLFARFIQPKNRKAVNRLMRQITSKLGTLRNIDEAGRYFHLSGRQLHSLMALLSVMRTKEMKSVTELLKKFPLNEVDLHLRKAVASLVSIDHKTSLEIELADYLSEISIQRYQTMIALLDSALLPEQVEERHAFRIAVKKWRYLMETMAQISGHDYQDALDELKNYQSALGDLNDIVEFKLLCGRLKFPDEERQSAEVLLNDDGVAYFNCFMEIAALRKPGYFFLL